MDDGDETMEGTPMQDFMKDRYGVDELTYVLGLGGMVLALIGSLADLRPLSWAAIAVVVLAILRAFSKNRDARRAENEAFRRGTAKVPGLGTLVTRLGEGMGRPGSTVTGPRTASARRGRPSKEELDRAKRTAKKMWSERKTTRFLKCPTCGQMLSVPKGKGKLRVTCPKCRTKMDVKS